ncbi:MAG: glycosyltransferase family 2 protein [Nitrospirae bacterium]|nr:MAG: glycosyltransferase family 2 protein [Nitrospirota bacterium]
MSPPKITFGIIVLNGEPFTRYCLRSIYPFAHEIIVVEGANRASASIATPDGHSTDGTLRVLKTFKEEEDTEDKLKIITTEGFWSEKDEQSMAYAERVTGDYLWQIDIDEFYHPHDMEGVIRMLEDDHSISTISFKQITFWGGFDYITDGWYLRIGAENCHRLFKWGPGYRYIKHRPPTVVDEKGRDLRSIRWIDGYKMSKMGMYLYHYSLVFPKQVEQKCIYYSQADWSDIKEARLWVENSFKKLKKPYRVHNVYQYPSWIERFRGKHPPQIEALRRDIERGVVDIELRPTEDVERLLNSKRYATGRFALKILGYIYIKLRTLKYLIKRKLKT